jgi:MinD-like ATPase involved in chromosome partitioning or flagellar assembly/ActR/RegA family two-component response regulator
LLGKSILIVDDNPASRIYLAYHLQKKQYTVLEAPTGKEGLIVAWRDKPDLILFDPTLRDMKDQEFIQKLRNDPRTRKTPLIALSTDANPARKEICLKAGVDEYLVKSSRTMLLLEESLARIFGPENTSEAARKVEDKKGLLIVFLSAKGGAGTSSLCANLAMNIRQTRPQARVVVVDLVLPIGSIGWIVGYRGRINLTTVADLPSEGTNASYFYENLPTLESWQFQLLAGSADPQQANKVKEDRVNEIVDILCSAYDFIILDTGRALSRISLPIIKKANLIIPVISTDQSAIALTRVVWNYLIDQGVEKKNIYAILNRTVGLEESMKLEAEKTTNFIIRITIPYMGSNLSVANNLNQPITTKYPTSTASMIFKSWAEDIVKLADEIQANRLKESER